MIDLCIAAVTCQAPVGQIEHNIARTIRWSLEARATGADLICFPELNITGYWNHAGIANLAQPIPGPVTQRIGQLAEETHLIILAGMAESNPHGRPFASHCVFYPNGKMDVYRKVHLAPTEKSSFAAGDTVPVFQAKGAIFGVQLCYDGHFPELSAAMTAKGADILFMPHASPRGDAETKHQSWMRHLPARAYDNSAFVVACNQWGDNGKGLQFPGNAVIVGPSGTILKKSINDREEMLVAELKASDLDAVRDHAMRYFFPHRRPELYGTL